MKNTKLYWVSLGYLLLIPVSCGSNDQVSFALDDGFGAYWYQGKAEITNYHLEQARYGQINEGHAVLIFVTEDFSKSKHVKLDNPGKAGKDAVKVLKLNATRKFNTGIYPYSMMRSVFTPVYRNDHPQTLKLTTSSQEWCGHTFTQLNLEDDHYRARLYSYFESEGDQDMELPDVLLEDELWNLIRLDPESLPVGTVKLIPGTMYQRLSHEQLKPYNARISQEVNPTNTGIMEYTINYETLDRKLIIYYNKSFPHEIERWEEKRTSGFGPDAKTLTTTAVKKKRMMLDYWNKNNVADSTYQQELGLR